MAAEGNIPSEILFPLVFYRIPTILELIMPLALSIATMLVLGRMQNDNEIVVLRSCGLSREKMLWYTLAPSIAACLFSLSLTTYVSPLAWESFYELMDSKEEYSGAGTLVAGRFKESEDNAGVMHIREMDQKKTHYREIFWFSSEKTGEGDAVRLVRSEGGRFLLNNENSKYLESDNGTSYEGILGRTDFRLVDYSSARMLVSSNNNPLSRDQLDSVTTAELFRSDDLVEQSIFHWRLALPFTIPIIAVFAFALSETNVRSRRYLRFLPAVMSYLVLLTCLIVVRTQIDKNELQVPWVYWPVSACFLASAFCLFYFQQIRRYFSR